jgi:glyoxylase-like metal-dependent hydrolase (beta-lactamase superfamily II)
VLWAAAANAEQQQSPATNAPYSDLKAGIRTTKLVDGIYMVEGLGGNIIIAVAKDGLIVVDAGPASQHDKVRGAIAAIAHQRIKFLVNTQFHTDHTGGNEFFAKGGATVVADAHVKNRMAAGTTDGLTGIKTPPAPTGALPAKTYTGSFRIQLNGRVADLNHIPNAYSDGDSFVWFKTANVLATGDTFTNGRYPDIDFANGGNVDGMIAAADTYLKLTDTNSKIVPGHGPVADKAELLDFYTMLVVARDRMDVLIQDGKSEGQVMAERPFADLDAKWAPTEMASKNFVRALYHSMTDKPAPPKKPPAQPSAQPPAPSLQRQVLHRN